MLYLIERFRLKAEWFIRDELYNLYTGHTSTGEMMLDREFRAYLFDGGIDYPFSQPESPSGKADVVALLDTNDPLALEVQIFDPDCGKGKANLTQGFHQILKYAGDYNQSVGYLVVFSCSDVPLIISGEDTSHEEFPVRISSSGKSFFVITVDINPTTPSATKQKPESRQIVSLNEMKS